MKILWSALLHRATIVKFRKKTEEWGELAAWFSWKTAVKTAIDDIG